MTLTELIPIISGITSTAAALFAYIGKEAVSSLQEEHRSNIRRIEEEHKNDLLKQFELFKRVTEFASKIDETHFNLRKESYAVLWRITSKLPKWPVNDKFKYDDLHEYSLKLCSWYFGDQTELALWYKSRNLENNCSEKFYTEGVDLNKQNVLPGGMLLTEDAKEAYFELQEKIAQIKTKGQSKLDSTLAKEDYEAVRSASSALRTELAKDLLTRKEVTVGQS
jgi:hypothetical protein